MAARKFNAVAGPKSFDLSCQTWRKKFLQLGPEHFAQNKKFEIGDSALPILQPRNRILARIPTRDLISNLRWFGVQRYLKPLADYYYDGTNSYYLLLSDEEMLVTDSQESRGMVSRSRTAAIGAQGPPSGQTRQGVIQSTVDLNAQFGLGSSEEEHGAFFDRPIQTVGDYYRQVLDDIRPPQ